jgi:L-lactate permease
MYQVYLLSVAYLLVGAGLLLVDEYGGTYFSLIRMRNTVRSKLPIRICLVILGMVLAVLELLLPIAPGPVVFGDLLPAICTMVLVIYHISQAVSDRKWKKAGQFEASRFGTQEHAAPLEAGSEDVLEKTSSLIETHKRNLGYLVLAAAVLHFLFPTAVLL